MNLLAQLATQIAGGAGAAVLDRAKPEWTRHVGASQTSPGVAITPGAMAAVGLAVLLAVLPGKAAGAGAPMWKTIAANLAGGGLVYEGTKLAELEVLPRLKAPGYAAPAAGTQMLTPGVQGMPYLPVYNGYNGYNGGPQTITDWQLAQALQGYRRAA